MKHLTSHRFLPLCLRVSTTLALVAAAGSAEANGRYPQATQLAEDPSDPERLWLLTTYGLLSSSDHGKSWHWICEEALGFSSSQTFDPMFGVHEDGTVIVGLLSGLKHSTNRGCDWSYVSDALSDHFVLDLAVDKREPSRSLALVSYGTSADGSSRSVYTNEIWQSTDNGKTFAILANNLPDNLFSTTLDSAPSDPERIYLSVNVFDPEAGPSSVPALMRSKDRGKSWERLPVPVPAGGTAYIAAIHPTNPDILYLRTRESTADGTVTSGLLYSSEGGANLREITRQNAPMLGFALSPDGQQVAVGFGDPGDGSTKLDASAVGLYRASAADLSFQKVYAQSISCLTWSGRGLYACSRLVPAGFDLGLSQDGGKTFESLQSRLSVAGPLACDPGAGVAKLCPAERWATVCERDLGCTLPDGGTTDDAGVPNANDQRNEEDNCACRVAGGSRGGYGLALGGALAVAGALRRRSRQPFTT